MPRTLLTSDGLGSSDFHEINVVSQPAIMTGVTITFDGVVAMSGFAGSVSTQSVPQSVSWGTGRRSGKSAAHFSYIDWKVMEEVDYPCLSEIGTYEGCIDSRFGNYDPTKSIQLSELSCSDNEAPVITLYSDQNQTISQFGYFNDTGGVAYDAVEGPKDLEIVLTRSTCSGPRNAGNDTGSVSFLGTVDAFVTGVYEITYRSEDSRGNKAVRHRCTNRPNGSSD